MWIKWFYFGVLKRFCKTACLTRDSCLPLPSEWTVLYCFPCVVERKSTLCRAVISLRPGQAVSLWLTGLQNVRKMCHAGMSLLQKGKWQGMSLLLWKGCGKQYFLEEWFCSRQTVISPFGLLCIVGDIKCCQLIAWNIGQNGTLIATLSHRPWWGVLKLLWKCMV